MRYLVLLGFSFAVSDGCGSILFDGEDWSIGLGDRDWTILSDHYCGSIFILDNSLVLTLYDSILSIFLSFRGWRTCSTRFGISNHLINNVLDSSILNKIIYGSFKFISSIGLRRRDISFTSNRHNYCFFIFCYLFLSIIVWVCYWRFLFWVVWIVWIFIRRR